MQIFGFKGYGITSDRAQGWERVMQRGEIGADIQTMFKVRKADASRRYLWLPKAEISGRG